MPALNDLTPEEEALFAQHGVDSAGPGGEPIQDSNDATQNNEQQSSEQPRDAQGKFISQQPTEQQNQQQNEQQNQQQPNEQQPNEQQNQQPRMVPHEALHAERERARRHAVEAQRATARLNAILATRQQQTQPETLPDLNEDPAGYIRGLEARLARFEEERQQETQYRQIDTGLQEDEALFAQQVPDYEQASEYYVQSRAKELLQFNTPQEAQRILTEEARAIAVQAWQRNMSAAQVVYGLAQARGYQYQPTQQQRPEFESAAQFEQRQQNGGQQSQPQQSQQNGQRRPQDVIQSVNRGQQASRSLSPGSGAASTQTLNAEAILAMSDDEFEQFLKLGEKGANSRFAAIGG